ncbi:hypothetical protein [Ornithinicoccus halotolerans]|uniref:hypothetical protein n=1 Tax=Ornithinicoccus halotolerans TaxID=1748220 RepID=UPI0018863597|nr:hypothetical protein [Ornithinicoccus halotolerans]
MVRTVAAASAAGALLGLLVGGVGGRLAMALLAAQNPDSAGALTDDGFPIGQFTVAGTIHLLGGTLQLGLLAGLVYVVLRGLPRGPRWLRIAVLTALGTVAFGAVVIQPDGVDFTALGPEWLPVALFLLIPAVFVVPLCLLVERWLAADSWFATAPLPKTAAVLLVWIASGPLLLLLVAALATGVLWRQIDARTSKAAKTGLTWTARALVTAIGIWALIALASDIRAVT